MTDKRNGWLGGEANAGAPSCLVAYGRTNVDALHASGLGTVVSW